jgi:hypothetical protein
MDSLEETSRRRYLAMRSLRLKAHLSALPVNAIEAIGDLDLSAEEFDSIDFARSSGLTISRLQRALALPYSDQLTSLRAEGIRLGAEALHHLRAYRQQHGACLEQDQIADPRPGDGRAYVAPEGRRETSSAQLQPGLVQMPPMVTSLVCPRATGNDSPSIGTGQRPI